MADLADRPFVKLTVSLSIFTANGTGDFFFSFSFHPQLSLSGIIVLQSQGRWGSHGPQHFSFRPGLSSAHCQHQYERTLMHHWGELPGKGWPLPKSMRFRQNRVTCFLKSNGLFLAHFHDAGHMRLHERSRLLNRHWMCFCSLSQKTAVFQLCSFLKVIFTGESVFFPQTKLKSFKNKQYFIQMPCLQWLNVVKSYPCLYCFRRFDFSVHLGNTVSAVCEKKYVHQYTVSVLLSVWSPSV